MKSIIINNEIKFDEDALSLADMGYEIGEGVEVFELGGDYFIDAKQNVVIDGIVAIYEGEEVYVTKEEIEVLA
ncbi:gp1 [Escherichia phage phiEB49]|uniref:Gp1 n=1 Tax=Escherichia phage phiEB49 TaxID=1048207 RepID=F8UBR1_9CAUD|nr:gp1 [Escherichia phage phiEB49]AEI91201.1 gp1 [Escherichia phage phiEB49]